MNNIFILEDSQNRLAVFQDLFKSHDNGFVIIATTAQDAIKVLNSIQFDTLYLDHDLGGKPPEYYGQNTSIDDPNTGSEVVRWMISQKSLIAHQPEIVIHSRNEKAALDMYTKLRTVGYTNVFLCPFSELFPDAKIV